MFFISNSAYSVFTVCQNTLFGVNSIKSVRLTIYAIFSVLLLRFPGLSQRLTVRKNGPRRDKTCLQGFRQSETKTGLLSYRDYIENRNFACSKLRYVTFQNANNRGADQTAWMRRLVCTFVVRKPPKTGFLASRPI